MNRNRFIVILLILMPILLAGCRDDSHYSSMGDHGNSTEDAYYPMHADDNSNGINDYMEQATHWSGPVSSISPTKLQPLNDGPQSPTGHDYIDENGNGICDFAEDGSNTWHGPGYIDENENGICDYWDEDSNMHNSHQGMVFSDENRNGINDSFEEDTHVGNGHAYVDANDDGICDLAQDGGNTWHGPGYMDDDHDGIHDEWQTGGRGHGQGHGHSR